MAVVQNLIDMRNIEQHEKNNLHVAKIQQNCRFFIFICFFIKKSEVFYWY